MQLVHSCPLVTCFDCFFFWFSYCLILHFVLFYSLNLLKHILSLLLLVGGWMRAKFWVLSCLKISLFFSYPFLVIWPTLGFSDCLSLRILEEFLIQCCLQSLAPPVSVCVIPLPTPSEVLNLLLLSLVIVLIFTKVWCGLVWTFFLLAEHWMKISPPISEIQYRLDNFFFPASSCVVPVTSCVWRCLFTTFSQISDLAGLAHILSCFQ